jgi:putative intracellular protease/amidase
VAPEARIKFRADDVLVLPGLGVRSENELMARLESRPVKQAIALVQRAAGAGAMIAASCASTFVLAEAGLLDGGSRHCFAGAIRRFVWRLSASW